MFALYSLFAVLLMFLAWAGYDFAVSRGWVKNEHTASMYIRHWVNSRPLHKILLAFVIVTGASWGAAYLLLHLIAQVI